jgi:hypothetical protein
LVALSGTCAVKPTGRASDVVWSAYAQSIEARDFRLDEHGRRLSELERSSVAPSGRPAAPGAATEACGKVCRSPPTTPIPIIQLASLSLYNPEVEERG